MIFSFAEQDNIITQKNAPTSAMKSTPHRSDRRTFLATAGYLGITRPWLQIGSAASAKSIDTPVLRISYEESGAADGFPIILLHGFPDDIHAWDDVAPPLTKAGYRV